jgi:hypothetical protein
MSAASPIEELLRRDHERLDGLLQEAVGGEMIDAVPYEAFRGGLLRHIGIEEKILIPFVRRRLSDAAEAAARVLSVAKQLKLDHAALAALLVPTPTREIVGQLWAVLARHNPLEEGREGFYAVCAGLASPDEDEDDLLRRITAAPAVPLAVHHDGPRAFANITRLLRAAGRIP